MCNVQGGKLASQYSKLAVEGRTLEFQEVRCRHPGSKIVPQRCHAPTQPAHAQWVALAGG